MCVCILMQLSEYSAYDFANNAFKVCRVRVVCVDHTHTRPLLSLDVCRFCPCTGRLSGGAGTME